MIVYEGPGDIFKTGDQTITCPVNTVGVMGAGLALAMRLKIPGLFEFYRDLCFRKELVVGKSQVYPIPNSDKQILLFPTKQHWSRPSKLEWIEDGLVHLRDNWESLGITSLSLPPIGCGYGQLDYTKCVKPLVYKHLGEIELPVQLVVIDPR